MGFNPTFYAGRPKLSEVTIDSDLNMGGRDISGVDTIGVDTIDVDLIRAGRVDSPYMPQAWPTEELGWGDGEPTAVVTHEEIWVADNPVDRTMLTANSQVEVCVRVTSLPSSETTFSSISAARVNGVDIHSIGALSPGSSMTTPPMILKPGDVLSANIAAAAVARVYYSLEIVYTGRFVQGREFDLTGKWLALGIDMKGLTATVTIQGVDMPYSDYAKYFPLAPSKLTISGDWDVTQIRPSVEVYV